MNKCMFIHKNYQYRYQKVQCSTSLRMEAYKDQGNFVRILQATRSIKSYVTAVYFLSIGMSLSLLPASGGRGAEIFRDPSPDSLDVRCSGFTSLGKMN